MSERKRERDRERDRKRDRRREGAVQIATHLINASLLGRSTLVIVLSHLVLSPMHPAAVAIVRTVPKQ